MCPEQLQSLDGCRKHPRLNLWAHEGWACFFNAAGHRLAHNYCPSHRAKQKGRGYIAPKMRHHENTVCHVLMGEIFYGERPTFIDSKGQPYFGKCHHLINDPLNYCPENLLCWLTYSEHSKADKRRRALEKVVPDGNLHVIPYDYLRQLQDPRVTSDDEFQSALESIREIHFVHHDPHELSDREISRHCEF